MDNKIHSAKVKTPIFEYKWQKEKPNKKFIQSRIESFIILIDNKENVRILDFNSELKKLIVTIISQGILIKLDKNYQKKFFRLTKFSKENF